MTNPLLREIIAEAEHADGSSPVSDQALLAVSQGRRTIVGADSAPGAIGTDVVGILGEGELDLVVRPTARGKGLGREAMQQLLELPDASGELRAWAHGENPAATALLTAFGFTPARTLYRLALPAVQLPAAAHSARPMPEGFRLTHFGQAGEPDRSDAWVSVNASAFADHPEQGQMTAADFAQLREEAWFDPEDLLLAIDESNDQLAGFAWIKTVDAPSGGNDQAAGRETELYVLGVDPKLAGIGLGAALFGASLARMNTRRPHRITLYVDADNTNAVALYERAGFGIDTRSTQWVRTAASN